MNGVYAAAAILIFMGTAAGFFQPLVMLLVGVLWLTHIMSYLCRAYQMDHGKKTPLTADAGRKMKWENGRSRRRKAF